MKMMRQCMHRTPMSSKMDPTVVYSIRCTRWTDMAAVRRRSNSTYLSPMHRLQE
jgi:hypothetical protein